ncbi:MAG: ABC transporter ATP-binding protein [Chloroflexi bacterium]|nr:ABC transporter ATP-binding protein [Chloroflexota bacterium]MCI0575802.1 ABC transporter ATP-binding protein [Chloroflexota bacterium]MCI0644893.1 ABC transporter ATP-binding protein [Chloroflexota bacterium]MCI0729710.1 ABC transporter ATP-binding protein [Chloroflexota bacterium]
MLLELQGVVAGYLKGVDVLQGIDLYVNAGEMVCLIGPNGAGKSTVLRTISGLLKPSQGLIHFDGQDIAGLQPDLVLRQGIAHVPQGHSAFPVMTVNENLLMGAYLLKDRADRKHRLERVYDMFDMLAGRRKEKAGNLSGGQQKVLEIGRALMMKPRLIMFDEPSLGLAPITAKIVFGAIKRLQEEAGITILMVEQNAKSGLAISDRAYVLELGKDQLEGPAHQLLNDPRVAQLYLGGSTLEATEEGREIVVEELA